jgi:hypothetical protein
MRKDDQGKKYFLSRAHLSGIHNFDLPDPCEGICVLSAQLADKQACLNSKA